jgi:hypothetical protein
MPIPDFRLFRGNFLIAFAGAAIIIFMIKVTPLILPAKYYFSFANLVGYNSEPFIVEPPGVTGEKLCALLEKYDIPKERFARVDCKLDYVAESKANDAGDAQFSVADKDRIYSLALQDDAQVRADLKTALQAAALPGEEEINTILSEAKTVGRAFERISESLKTNLDNLIHESVGTRIEQAYNALAPPAQAEQPEDAAEDKGPVPPDASAAVLAAYRSALAQMAPSHLGAAINPITKSEVDKAIVGSYGWYGVGNNIAQYYKRSVSEDYVHKVLRDEFKNAGLVIRTPEEQRRLIFAEINQFSWFNYVVSILIRLTPVVLFGVAAGYFLGRTEIGSIGVAGALAAFLLSWPLMLMWDHLVTSTWQDKKATFLAFYAAYVAAFFLTARASALLGAKLRQQTHGVEPEGQPGETPQQIQINWNKVMTNLAGAAIINLLVFAANVIIPLQASASN